MKYFSDEIYISFYLVSTMDLALYVINNLL